MSLGTDAQASGLETTVAGQEGILPVESGRRETIVLLQLPAGSKEGNQIQQSIEVEECEFEARGK